VSRDLLDGELASGTKKMKEHYETGEEHTRDSLVDNLVGQYETIVEEMWRSRKWVGGFDHKYKEKVRELSEMLPTDQDFDANKFLDDLTWYIPLETDITHACYFNYFIDPVLQALYNNGHNDFVLDFNRLPPTSRILGFQTLRGKDDNLLSVTILGDVIECGDRVSYCKIEVLGNVGWAVGTMASGCEFVIHGSVRKAGRESVRCKYELSDFDPLPRYSQSDAEYLNNEYHVRAPLTPSVRKKIFESDFFIMKNRLFVPRTDTEWEEVTP